MGKPPPGADRPRTEREYGRWRAMANGRAFRLATTGLARGVAAAARALGEFEPIEWRWGNEVELVAAVLADLAPPWLADAVGRHLRLNGKFPSASRRGRWPAAWSDWAPSPGLTCRSTRR
jgi:hypothetical protein